MSKPFRLEAIQAGVQWSWETIPQYLDALDQRLGLNVASLIGHSAVRRYVMGNHLRSGTRPTKK
jgi:N-acyl-D-aspartate/D-glutamate deacylase